MHGCCLQTRQPTWRFGLSAQAFASSSTDIQLKERVKRGQCLNQQSLVFTYLSCQLKLATSQISQNMSLCPFTIFYPPSHCWGTITTVYIQSRVPQCQIVRARNGFGKKYKHPSIFKPQQGMNTASSSLPTVQLILYGLAMFSRLFGLESSEQQVGGSFQLLTASHTQPFFRRK